MSASMERLKMQKIIKICWVSFAFILFLCLVAEMLFYHTSEKAFYYESTIFFHAWFGFSACAVIVLISKLLGFLLKRNENYYSKEDKNN